MTAVSLLLTTLGNDSGRGKVWPTVDDDLDCWSHSIHISQCLRFVSRF